MYANTWFPKLNAIGVSWEEFWKINPRIVSLLIKGHKERMIIEDEQMHSMGAYVCRAVAVAIENNFAKNPKAKYFEKPFMQNVQTQEVLSEEEKQKAVDLFFAKEKARRVNWRRNHPKSDTVS